MSRFSILGLVALGPLLFACAGPGGEAPAPTAAPGGNYPQGFACPPAGAVLTMDDGTVTHFLGAVPGDAEACRWSSAAGGGQTVAELYGIWNTRSEDTPKARAALRQLFPLQTGNTASFTILPEGVGEWRLTYTVHGRQTLTVPAGRFDTWVIDYEQQLMLAGNFLGRERLFLADNGMIIRREPTVVRGYVPPGSPFAKLPSQAVSIRMP